MENQLGFIIRQLHGFQYMYIQICLNCDVYDGLIDELNLFLDEILIWIEKEDAVLIY